MDGFTYTAGLGYFEDGRLAEVFLNAQKIGTAIETTARDSAVVAVLKGPRPRHCQVSRPGRLAPATMEATCELIVPAPAWMWDRGGALRAQSLME
jgi:hypothetical protein